VPADVTYYTPTDRGFEATIRERMAEIERRRQLSREAKSDNSTFSGEAKSSKPSAEGG
ncbi:MAG: hypothetical protein JNK93_20185, partial [Planctomycetia bacterium]|nr:hypothetical protein [Planctomycetia bacterium]